MGQETDQNVTSLEQWKRDHQLEQSMLIIPAKLWLSFWIRVTLPSYWFGRR